MQLDLLTSSRTTTAWSPGRSDTPAGAVESVLAAEAVTASPHNALVSPSTSPTTSSVLTERDKEREKLLYPSRVILTSECLLYTVYLRALPPIV